MGRLAQAVLVFLNSPALDLYSLRRANPSAKLQILDFSSFGTLPGERLPQVTALAGVAADGVIRIELLKPDGGTVAVFPVRDNFYGAS